MPPVCTRRASTSNVRAENTWKKKGEIDRRSRIERRVRRLRRPLAEQNDRKAELEVECAGADGNLRSKSAAKEQKPVSGGSQGRARTFLLFGIKDGRSDVESRSSNWNNYHLATCFERPPRARAARQPSPRLDLAQKVACSCRAATGLCSAPRDGRQDHPGESGPPRRSLGDASDAAGTASEQGRLP